MDIIERFINEKMDVEYYEYVEKLRRNFVNDYPINSIMSLSLYDYLIATEGVQNDNSFCRRIRREMEPLCHMGDVRYDAFGLYFKNGITLSISKTFKNKHGSDFDSAFLEIKELIVKLLEDGKDDNYEEIENNILHRSFKFKLLAIYYPEKIVPVCTMSKLDEYLESVGIKVDSKERMVYKNRKLFEWKNSVPEMENWSNYTLMRFCDWLLDIHEKVDGYKMKKEYYIDKAAQISKEIDKYNLSGKEKESLIKTRVNQNIFRSQLLKKYKYCCLCGVSNPELLIAGHIKPWSVSEPEEKLDSNNGFLFCPNHDRLFDQGWISFSDDGLIMISEELNQIDRIFTNVKDGNKIRYKLTDSNRRYLKYHRENIFKR